MNLLAIQIRMIADKELLVVGRTAGSRPASSAGRLPVSGVRTALLESDELAA
jgi:hypothetical protein